MALLAADWQEQLAAEQKARSAALMHAALTSDWQVIDRAVARCEQWDQVRKFAALLHDALWQAGWVETRPTYGPLDEGEA